MYPPLEDRVYEVQGSTDIRRLATLAHDVYIRSNGAIASYLRRNNVLLFAKAGHDGMFVDLG